MHGYIQYHHLYVLRKLLSLTKILIKLRPLSNDWAILILVFFKDVPGGFPKSDLLGVTVARIHVVGQQFLAV